MTGGPVGRFCPSCGEMLEPGEDHCSGCGSALERPTAVHTEPIAADFGDDGGIDYESLMNETPEEPPEEREAVFPTGLRLVNLLLILALLIQLAVAAFVRPGWLKPSAPAVVQAVPGAAEQR